MLISFIVQTDTVHRIIKSYCILKCVALLEIEKVNTEQIIGYLNMNINLISIRKKISFKCHSTI